MDIIVGIPAQLPAGLFEALARYRHRLFVETLQWPLRTHNEMELDQFDRPDTVYLAACQPDGEVIGTARLLCTQRPYLLQEVFPELLGSAPAPHTHLVWELSRFGTGTFGVSRGAAATSRQFDRTIAPLLLRAALCFAASKGARHLISVSPLGIERILRREGFSARRFAAPVQIDWEWLFACWIDVMQIQVAQPSATQVLC